MADPTLKAVTDASRRENIRVLRGQGYSEADAITKAHAEDANADADPVDDLPDAADGSDADEGDAPARSFVVVTKDFSGLGWAKTLQEEGETVTLAVRNPEEKPEDRKLFEQVAKGWIPRMDLDQAITTLKSDSTYWLFTENCFCEEADQLRKQGQKVFGTSALCDRLEHDRQYAIDTAEAYGLAAPPSHAFTSREEGLAFLDAHPDQAYVFKPDDGQFNYLTFVPFRSEDADANREVYTYLDHMQQEPGSYVLQERIHGTEVNVEVWLYEGEPCLALCTVEAKRKNSHDTGEMAGCAGDVVWVVPPDSPLVEATVGKMLSFYREQKYTGFADANVILTAGGAQFLEVCNRFGYNSHATLFLGLAVDTVGNILADFMDGHVDDLVERFRPDIGASVTLFLDHPREGLPIHVAEKYQDSFFPFDGYMEDDTLLLSGYSSEVGILVGWGLNVETAMQSVQNALEHEEAVSFPDMHYRSDFTSYNYQNSILARVAALNDQWGHSMRIRGGGR